MRIYLELSEAERQALLYLRFFAEEAHRAAAQLRELEPGHAIAMELSLGVLARLTGDELIERSQLLCMHARAASIRNADGSITRAPCPDCGKAPS